MVDMNRVAIERRHSQFDYARNSADKSFYAACANRLLAQGWQWRNSRYTGGWWVLPDSDYELPMGDPKEFSFGAFKTVQLYTEITLDEIQAVAAEFRRDRLERSLAF